MPDTPATGEAARGLDLDAIEWAARAATPGPWEYGNEDGYGQDNVYAPSRGLIAQGVGDSGEAEATAEYIAALNPSVALALIDRLRAAEADRDAALARVKELEAGLEPFAVLSREFPNAKPDADMLNIHKGIDAFVTMAAFHAAARLLAGKDGADG